MRLVYTAYPIDAAGTEKAWVEMVKQAIAEIHDYGAAIYDPGDAFSLPPKAEALEIGPEIASINRAALLRCDTLLAFLPPGVPSIGVPIEIERAINAGKNVGVVGAGGSWMLGGYTDEQIVWEREFTQEGVYEVIARLSERPEPRKREREVAERLRFAPTGAGQPRLPTRGYPDDAGLDLFTSENVTLEPGEFRTVPTGLAVELPEWGWGLITGRSSSLQRGLLVKDAVIDSGYRGELFANVWNLTDRVLGVDRGERIAQLVVMPNLTKDLMPTLEDRLSESDRGTGGFGSTGR